MEKEFAPTFEVEYFGFGIIAPIWVTHIATDENGSVYGFSSEPYIPERQSSEWVNRNEGQQHALLGKLPHDEFDWKRSMCCCKDIKEEEVMSKVKKWKFKTNQALDLAEVFVDLSRANPIGICRKSDDSEIVVGIHSSLAVLYCDGAPGGKVVTTALNHISELAPLINELREINRSVGTESEYEVSYPQMNQ